MTERFVLSLGAGAAGLSTLVFVLCSIGLARTPWLVLAALLVIALFVARLPRRRVQQTGIGPAPLYFWLIAVPFAIVYVVNAAAPEISPDGSYYHLGLVRRYLNHGGFYRITTDLYASLSQGCEMLFLVAYSVGRHSAAALTHCLFLLALPAAMAAYGRRFGIRTPALLAALMVFVSPIVGIDGASAYVDVALAFTAFTCFYALELWNQQLEIQYLICAGLLAGFCFAIKYSGAPAILFAVLYVAWRARRVQPLITLLSSAAMLAVPWLIKNWITVGNPVSPFFNRVFPNPYIHISFEDAFVQAMRHLNGFHIGWQAPFELTLRGGSLQGTLGPIFLLAPIALLAGRDPHGRRALGAAALFGLPWFSNAGTRFLIPSLPFVALSMAIALARWPRFAAALVMLNAIACWPWVLSLYCAPYNWRITRFPLAAALRITPERQFLDTYAPEVRFARLLQDQVPPGGVVYTAQPVMSSYTDRTIVLNYAAALNERLADVLASAIQPAMQPSDRVSFRFAPQEIHKLRFIATSESPMWTVHEIENAPAAIRTSANPWDATLAADGRPVTAWRSWQAVRPGMFIEAEMPGAGRIGFVSFSTRPADPSPRIRMEMQTARGVWHDLPSAMERHSGVPVGDLRGQAMDELRRCGITHLLIHDAEPLGRDFREHTAGWKITLVGESAPVRLYSIDTAREVLNN